MWKVTFGFFETHTGEAGEITFKSQTLSILPGDGRYPTVESCCANLEKVKQSKMYAFQTTGTQKIFSDICKWTDTIRSKRAPDITSESSAHIDEVKKALVRFCVHPLSLGGAASSATQSAASLHFKNITATWRNLYKRRRRQIQKFSRRSPCLRGHCHRQANRSSRSGAMIDLWKKQKSPR